MIDNNFMVSATFYHYAERVKYFNDEKSAREYANRLYSMDDIKTIELLERRKDSYTTIKKITRLN